MDVYACCKLKEIKGITDFNMSNAINYNELFNGCHELDYLIISNGKIDINISKLKSKYNENKLIAVIFTSTDWKINFAILCKESDNFSIIETKLLNQFPELKSKNIVYIANGSVVDKNLTLKENKIKNSTNIVIHYSD